MQTSERPTINVSIDLEDFFKTKVPAIISHIKGDEPALWGIMTVHHMLEHLVLPLNFVNGTTPMTQLIPDEKLPRQLEFLASNLGLPKNFKPIFLPTDKNVPLVFDTLDKSKKYLLEKVEEFLSIIQSSNFTNAIHPFYGTLDKNGWLLFQYKHFAHHFMQFGLM